MYYRRKLNNYRLLFLINLLYLCGQNLETMRLTVILTIIFIFTYTDVFAQERTAETISQKVYLQTSDAEKYALRINKYDLEDHVKMLCSPEFEGRRFGSNGNKKAMEYILSEFKRNDLPQSKNNWQKQFFKQDSTFGVNVIGVIEGSLYPDENVIITCHYDGLGIIDTTLFQSADDNATGVAALIELAEAFSAAIKDGIHPKRTIILVAFDAGKQEMLGSKIYAKYPIKPLSKTQILLNMDMLGRDDCGLKINEHNYVFLLGNNEFPPNSKQITDSINSSYTHLNVEYNFYKNDYVYQLFYPTSDHYSLAHLVPSIFYTGGINGDVQSQYDTADKISYTTLRKRVQLVFYTAWHYANR